MKLYIIAVGILFSVLGYAQEKFIIVNNDSISVEKFREEYKENIAVEGLQSAKNAFINFSLLRQEAQKSKLDTTKRFQLLYNQSFQPIKEKYLIDFQIEDELKQDIWKNLKNDRKAQIYAIGIKNKYDSKEVEKREQLIQDLYQTTCKNAVASVEVKQYLDNHMQRELWLRPFTIPAEIEKVIYNTPVGRCSQITSSNNGNFFVKVVDERSSLGIVYLDHIFNTDKAKINEAYDQLQSNEEWSDIRERLNLNSAQDSIRRQQMYQADIPEVFYHKIKGVEKEYIEPFAYKGGYYLIKKINQKKFDNYDNWEEWLSKRIMGTDYSLHYVQNTEDRAVETVEVQEDKKALKEVVDALGKDFFQTSDTLILEGNKPIWTVNDSKFTQQQFLREMHLAKKYYKESTDIDVFLKDMIPNFKRQFTLNVYIANMEKYEPELAREASVLKNSILMDHYLDHDIYKKAKNDTVGLKNYLAQHQNEYMFPKRYKLEMYSFEDDADGEKIINMMKAGKSKDDILNGFLDKRGENGALEVVRKFGEFNANSSEFDVNFNPKEKYQISNFHGKKVVMHLLEILPSRPKSWEEAGYLLKEAYTKYYYDQTINKLRKDATIIVPATL